MRSRRGQSLLLVLLLLVVLGGVLALTLDFGFILLARNQMQTSVNSAALEGLRNLDTNGDMVGDGRVNAATVIRNIADDDLDPTSNETTIGGGIDSSLVQGNGFRATQLGDGAGARDLFQRRSDFVYRPNPQLNLSNEPHGDFVNGTYTADESAADAHEERADYSRNDFETELNGNAFLARLRRTHNANSLDQIADVSSSGDGLPLIMGRIGWMAERSTSSEYSVRHDGISVRATAIADSQPAVRVWPEDPSANVFGAIAFAIRKSDFLLPSSPADAIESTTIASTLIGMPVTFTGGSYSGEVGYVAVVDDVATTPRVIGFWLAPDPTDAPTRLPNASPRLSDAWEILGTLSAQERSELFASRREVVENGPHELLAAPALVRSVR